MHFTFITKPTTNGANFTTRPDFGPDWTQAELDTLVSAAHATPPEKCRAIGREYFLQLLGAATPRRCLELFDLLYARPTSGGVKPAPGDFHNATDIKADFALGYLASAIRDFRETTTIEAAGAEGVAAPEIETILDELTGQPGHYTTLQMMHLIGENLGFERTNTGQGVFIADPPDGTWVRLATYGPISDTHVHVLIPAGNTGPKIVKVINERGHPGNYSGEITPSV